MPYTTQEDRKQKLYALDGDSVDDAITFLSTYIYNFDAHKAKGAANYIITRILSEGIAPGQQYNYSRINDIIGVLECAKLEFYRRIAAPYEDVKIRENGDIPGYEGWPERSSLEIFYGQICEILFSGRDLSS